MRVTVVALGTRGDVQPMLALALELKKAGDDVCFVAGSNFAEWVQSYGLRFAPSADIEALMKSPEGVTWVEGSDNQFKQLSMMRRLLDKHGQDMVRPLIEAAPQTDVFISGFVSEPFVQSVCEKFQLPQINAPLQPYRPTRDGRSTMAALLPRKESIFNYWVGLISERFIWSVARDSVNRMRAQTLGLPPHSAASYTRASRRIPTVYGFSRHVVPPASDWDDKIAIGGYWFLDEDQNWQPPAALLDFLSAGQPPVYVGFGSMSSSDPQATVDMIAEALRRSRQRGIMLSGWSGASASASRLPEHIFMIDKAPHGWLFEHVAAVVHHGGAGTTAAGLRAGKPTFIIPHMADQPFWGRRVFELGVGVKPVQRHRLTVDKLAQGIQTITTDPQLQQNASALGENIRAERGVETTVTILQRFIRG